MSTSVPSASRPLLGGQLQYPEEERRNIRTCEELFSLLFDNTHPPSAASVAHLCTADSQFVGPSTLPGISSILEYANNHGGIMQFIPDFSLLSYDAVLAKGNLVVFRYTADGHHKRLPYKGIPPSGKYARWHGTDIFQLDPSSHKIQTLIKEFDKAAMWAQLGQTRTTRAVHAVKEPTHCIMSTYCVP